VIGSFAPSSRHRATTRIASVAAIVGVLATSSVVVAEGAPPPTGPDQATQVLPPETSRVLPTLFAPLEPGLRLESAAIAHDHVKAQVCAADVCSSARWSHAGPGCTGRTAGAFCVVWEGAAPPFADAVERVLASATAGALWREIAARPPQPAALPAPETPTTHHPGPTTPHPATPTAPDADAMGAGAAPAATTDAGAGTPRVEAPTPQEPAAAAHSDADEEGSGMRWIVLGALLAAAAYLMLRKEPPAEG
jgi:hypothetical protein